jgi:hypothetical protein
LGSPISKKSVLDGLSMKRFAHIQHKYFQELKYLRLQTKKKKLRAEHQHILLGIYMDGLLVKLIIAQVGCFIIIGNVLLAVLA